MLGRIDVTRGTAGTVAERLRFAALQVGKLERDIVFTRRSCCLHSPLRLRPLDVCGVPRPEELAVRPDGSFTIDGTHRKYYYFVERQGFVDGVADRDGSR
jgi:hypothetical protein